MKPRNFCVITNSYKDKDKKTAKAIKNYLEMKGATANVVDMVSEDGSNFLKISPDEVAEDTDMIITVGGDGTLLHAAIDLYERDLSFVGVNKGTLGFLAEISLNDMEDYLDRLLAGEYTIQNRIMLTGKVVRDGNVIFEQTVLNDVVVHRDGGLHTANYKVKVDGDLLGEFNGDGMIVSTPTGSTGYNLSAGGPIAKPTSDMIILTPVCSHSMNNSSILLSTSDTIAINAKSANIHRNENIKAYFDGGEGYLLEENDSVIVEYDGKMTSFVKLDDESFLQTIKDKIGI